MTIPEQRGQQQPLVPPRRAADLYGPEPDTIDDLLTRAVATEVPRIVRAADKIREQLADLEKDVDQHERSAELVAEAAKLEARLAEIRGQIGRKPKRQPTGGDHDAKAVRRWAAEQGLECPQHGRIPNSVLHAYQERNGS